MDRKVRGGSTPLSRISPPDSSPTPAATHGPGKLRSVLFVLHRLPELDAIALGSRSSAKVRPAAPLRVYAPVNLAQPIRLFERTILNGESSAEFDHHAFLYWPPENLVVLPISLYADKPYKASFSGAIGLNVDASIGIADRGLIDHPAKRPPEVLRSLVVGDRLFTLSEVGIEMEALATLAEQAWLPFPAAAPDKPSVPE